MRTFLIAAVVAVATAGLAWILLLSGGGDEPLDPVGPGADETATTAVGTTSEPSTIPTPPAESDLTLPERLERALSRIRARGFERIRPALDDLDPIAETEEGVLELADYLRDSDDEELRALVVMALQRSPFDLGKDQVLSAARGEFGPELRSTALLTMSEDDRPESLKLFANTLAVQEDPAVRSAALQALCFQNSPQAHKVLAETLDLTNEPELRAMIWLSLRGEMLPIPDPDQEPTATREMRFHRHLAIYEVDNPEVEKSREAFQRIAGQARLERDPMLRAFAASALLNIGSPTMREPFLEIWTGMEPELRAHVITRLTPDTPPGKFPAILEVGSRMERPDVRRVLAERAVDVATVEEVAALEEWAARETDAEIRRMLEDALESARERK